VTVIADHRVLDGAAVAKALARLEDILTTELVAELRTARPAPAEAAA
jgi:pyruvate/2-oxoglutarate dehydrogenase complex dihydrolipoamide acyltransferase (E2) component